MCDAGTYLCVFPVLNEHVDGGRAPVGPKGAAPAGTARGRSSPYPVPIQSYYWRNFIEHHQGPPRTDRAVHGPRTDASRQEKLMWTPVSQKLKLGTDNGDLLVRYEVAGAAIAASPSWNLQTWQSLAAGTGGLSTPSSGADGGARDPGPGPTVKRLPPPAPGLAASSGAQKGEHWHETSRNVIAEEVEFNCSTYTVGADSSLEMPTIRTRALVKMLSDDGGGAAAPKRFSLQPRGGPSDPHYVFLLDTPTLLRTTQQEAEEDGDFVATPPNLLAAAHKAILDFVAAAKEHEPTATITVLEINGSSSAGEKLVDLWAQLVQDSNVQEFKKAAEQLLKAAGLELLRRVPLEGAAASSFGEDLPPGPRPLGATPTQEWVVVARDEPDKEVEENSPRVFEVKKKLLQLIATIEDRGESEFYSFARAPLPAEDSLLFEEDGPSFEVGDEVTVLRPAPAVNESARVVRLVDSSSVTVEFEDPDRQRELVSREALRLRPKHLVFSRNRIRKGMRKLFFTTGAKIADVSAAAKSLVEEARRGGKSLEEQLVNSKESAERNLATERGEDDADRHVVVPQDHQSPEHEDLSPYYFPADGDGDGIDERAATTTSVEHVLDFPFLLDHIKQGVSGGKNKEVRLAFFAPATRRVRGLTDAVIQNFHGVSKETVGDAPPRGEDYGKLYGLASAVKQQAQIQRFRLQLFLFDDGRLGQVHSAKEWLLDLSEAGKETAVDNARLKIARKSRRMPVDALLRVARVSFFFRLFGAKFLSWGHSVKARALRKFLESARFQSAFRASIFLERSRHSKCDHDHDFPPYTNKIFLIHNHKFPRRGDGELPLVRCPRPIAVPAAETHKGYAQVGRPTNVGRRPSGRRRVCFGDCGTVEFFLAACSHAHLIPYPILCMGKKLHRVVSPSRGSG